jgi:hypothetical protein
MNIKRLDDYLCQVSYKKNKVWIGETKKNLSKAKADIVIAPGAAAMSYTRKENQPFIISSPGEYEASGISVFGEPEFFVMEIADIRVCYIQTPDAKLTDDQLEEIDGVDVLLLPIKKGALDADKIKKILGQIQPNILIPLSSNNLTEFLKTAGLEKTNTMDKLKVTKTDIPEEMEVVVLN